MTTAPPPSVRVLAIDPISKGFGFVVLESSPTRLIDWGTRTCRRTGDSLGQSVSRLCARCSPTALVLEDPETGRSYTRRLALTAAVGVIVATMGESLPVHLISRQAVESTFATLGATDKRDRVGLLVERFPELAGVVPPRRYIWQSEDSRWAIFDALALAILALHPTVDSLHLRNAPMS